MKIAILNGPNLNLLGRREPAIYGTRSMEQVLVNIAKAVYDSEGVMGIVLNAGGYTHTSVALRDAVACSQVPVVEVHVSNITEREEFRRISLLTDVCQHTIMGQGTEGYKQAIAWILTKINKSK